MRNIVPQWFFGTKLIDESPHGCRILWKMLSENPIYCLKMTYFAHSQTKRYHYRQLSAPSNTSSDNFSLLLGPKLMILSTAKAPLLKWKFEQYAILGPKNSINGRFLTQLKKWKRLVVHAGRKEHALQVTHAVRVAHAHRWPRWDSKQK